MAKQLMFDEEAHLKIRQGVRAIAGTMKLTLGPTGKNVILEKTYGAPEIVKDGEAISKELELSDPFENMGAKMVAEAATKTADVVGDGTTTTAILTQSIYEQSLRYLTGGANPVFIKRGIDKAVETVVKELARQSIPVKDKSDYKHIATIASNHNQYIGGLIAEAMDKVGKEGVITVEEGKGRETTLEFAKGLEFDKGYISPYFINKPDDLSVELEEPYILVYEKKITNVQEFLPILEQVVPTGKPLLVIAEEVEGEALALLVVNKLQRNFNACAVKAPAFGDRKKAILEDIAIVTGGQMLSEDLGVKLENVRIADLGRARRVRVEKEKTTIIEGQGDQNKINDRIKQLRTLIKETTSDYDREKYEERLAKLTGGVALIKVGAPTETEMKEKKTLVECAVNAARAARDEGIVAGGGIAYLRALPRLKELEATLHDENEKLGVRIIANALEVPLREIASNSGKDAAMIVAEVREKEAQVGFDAITGQLVNMVESGIVDPTKVLRLALQNAASVASMMLISRTLITDLKDKKKMIEGSIR